jgi:outer membrane protein
MKILGVAIVMIALLASCGDKGKKSGGAGSDSSGEVAAFYFQDSISEHFKYYKDVSTDLEIEVRKYEEMEMKINQEGQTLQNNYQRQKVAGMLSANEDRRKQQAIGKIGEKLQILQQTDGVALQKKNADFMETLIEKMEKYAKEYSKKNGYTILFARQKGGQILYMPDSKNVTMEFINYMNSQEKK